MGFSPLCKHLSSMAFSKSGQKGCGIWVLDSALEWRRPVVFQDSDSLCSRFSIASFQKACLGLQNNEGAENGRSGGWTKRKAWDHSTTGMGPRR